MDNMDMLTGTLGTIFFIFCIGGVLVYFIPAAIAFYRKHPNDVAIFVLNILLGWTFIGWVVALVWACSGTDKTQNNSTINKRELELQFARLQMMLESGLIDENELKIQRTKLLERMEIQP